MKLAWASERTFLKLLSFWRSELGDHKWNGFSGSLVAFIIWYSIEGLKRVNGNVWPWGYWGAHVGFNLAAATDVTFMPVSCVPTIAGGRALANVVGFLMVVVTITPST